MFEKLNSSEKIMYFKNERTPLTYPQALKELAKEIGRPNLLPQELEETIINSLKNVAIQLNLDQQPNPEDYGVVVAFHGWVQSIHNKNLAASKDSPYPNNIVYDMLSSLRDLRTKDSLNPETVLLHFFLEGANARKLSNGNTPDLEFIATTLELDVLSAVKKLAGGELSKAASQFFEKYDSLKNYVNPQKYLESTLTQLKNKDELYGFLSAEDIFNFKREKNPITGANRYLVDQAIDEGLIAALKKFNSHKLPNKVKDMVENIKNTYPAVLSNLESAQKNSTAEAHILAMWDASEWLARLHVALSIAAQYVTQYAANYYSNQYQKKLQKFIYQQELEGFIPKQKELKEFTQQELEEFTQQELEKFIEHPLVADVVLRNRTGDFPAKERGVMLRGMDITELFTQGHFAEARKTAITEQSSAPVYSNLWNAPSGPQPGAASQSVVAITPTPLIYNG